MENSKTSSLSATNILREPSIERAQSFRKNEQYLDAIACLKAMHDESALQNIIQYELGLNYHYSSNLDKAVHHYKAAISLDADKAKWHFNLGAAYAGQGNMVQAKICFERANTLEPEWPDAIAALAGLLERCGNLEQAIACLEKTVKSNLGNINCLLIYSRIERRLRKKISVKTHIEDYSETCRDMHEREAAYFELGAIYDQEKQYKTAYKYFEKANASLVHIYDQNDSAKTLRNLMDLFPKPSVVQSSKNPQSRSNPVPIFIVGMPRTGTTLLHEILAAHPEIQGLGEVRFFDTLFQNLPAVLEAQQENYVDALKTITEQHRRQWRDHYFSSHKLPKPCSATLDKMPGNLHYLGLIENIMPQAKVIYCRRNPLDTCLSCFFQKFSDGHAFSYDLEHVAHYYYQQQKLWLHWQQTLSLDMFECCYEKLIANSDDTIQATLDFLGLEAHDNCLNHYKFVPSSYTASYHQANEPLYDHSRERYLGYAPYVAKLKSALKKYARDL